MRNFANNVLNNFAVVVVMLVFGCVATLMLYAFYNQSNEAPELASTVRVQDIATGQSVCVSVIAVRKRVVNSETTYSVLADYEAIPYQPKACTTKVQKGPDGKYQIDAPLRVLQAASDEIADNDFPGTVAMDRVMVY